MNQILKLISAVVLAKCRSTLGQHLHRNYWNAPPFAPCQVAPNVSSHVQVQCCKDELANSMWGTHENHRTQCESNSLVFVVEFVFVGCWRSRSCLRLCSCFLLVFPLCSCVQCNDVCFLNLFLHWSVHIEVLPSSPQPSLSKYKKLLHVQVQRCEIERTNCMWVKGPHRCHVCVFVFMSIFVFRIVGKLRQFQRAWLAYFHPVSVR